MYITFIDMTIYIYIYICVNMYYTLSIDMVVNSYNNLSIDMLKCIIL